MEEISGVAFIFNQKFFQDLKQETGERENACSNQAFATDWTFLNAVKGFVTNLIIYCDTNCCGVLMLPVVINSIIHSSVLLLLLIFISKSIYVSPL